MARVAKEDTTYDKDISTIFKELQVLKEKLVEKATALNKTLVSLTGSPLVLPEDPTKGNYPINLYMEHIENLKYTCESIKADIHSNREDIRIRVASIEEYLS